MMFLVTLEMEVKIYDITLDTPYYTSRKLQRIQRRNHITRLLCKHIHVQLPNGNETRRRQERKTQR